MVRIAERIWPAWREQAEKWDEPSLHLLFAPTGDHGEAAAALRASVLEVQDAFDSEAEGAGDDDPPFTGEWNWVRVPDGVLVQVVECQIFEKVLPAVAAALERRGIEGSFELRERGTVETPPSSAHLLECRARLRGERMERSPGSYGWEADPDAHSAVLAIAEGWCRERGRPAVQTLAVSTVGPVPVSPGEDVLDRMREAVADRMHVELSAVAADEFRSVAARLSGGISLVVGGPRVEAGEWREALGELTALLRAQADLFVYAYVRRGWSVKEALLNDRLPYDWPHREDHQPGGGFTREAFDDLYAPDAFAVQLLGPGYAGRVPESARWRREPAGTASVLLEHVDPPAWFDAPFIPFREPPRSAHPMRPAPVLAEARVELAPLLYAPGVLASLGYTGRREPI